MRISISETDPGFHPEAHRYGVTLDGKPLDLCITADEEEGLALCHVRGESGCLLQDPQRPGHLLTESKRGIVKVARL